MNAIKQMLSVIKNSLSAAFFAKRKKTANNTTSAATSALKPKAEMLRGGVLSALLQKKLTAKRPKIQLAGVTVERNYWAIATVLLSSALLLTVIALYHQTNAYENNVRTLMVKLYPNGTYDVNRVNFDGMPNYFLTTVNSLLSNFVKRRFSKNSDSITSDYGYAYQFMSPALRNRFMNEEHAGSTAHAFENCSDCDQVSVKVGVIQHYEADSTITHAKPDHEYRSTVFATFVTRTPDGTLISNAKKIITLVWRIRALRDLNNHVSSVRADPIGLVIVRASVKSDPTASTTTAQT